MVMPIFPVWSKRRNDDKSNGGLKAEASKNTVAPQATSQAASKTAAVAGAASGPVAQAPSAFPASGGQALSGQGTGAVAAADAAPRPIGQGLPFASASASASAPVGGGSGSANQANLTQLSCHGEPRQVEHRHRDTCNPDQGDTSCRVVLPVLFFQGKGQPLAPKVQAGQYQGGSGGVLGATELVMGAILISEAAVSARCEKALGMAWRLAEFHAAGGWGVPGKRGMGLAPNTRFWVHINDQLRNSWGGAP